MFSVINRHVNRPKDNHIMQKTILTLLGVTTLALTIVCAAQWRKLRVMEERLHVSEATRQAETEARQAETVRLHELERHNRRLDQQVKDFTAVTTSLRTSEALQSSNLTALAEQVRATIQPGDGSPDGTEEKSGFFGKEMGNMVQKMMKDPAMREMMRSQQQSAVKMMYNGLFKEMKVTPEEKEKLVGILTDAQMKTVENAQGMFGDNAENTDALETGKQIADIQKQSEADIKALLGDERNNQFKDYKSNISERMQLDQLQTRLETDNVPLQEPQMARLLEAMKQEKAISPAPIPSDASQNPGDIKSLMTSETIDKQIQWMNDYNQRVLDRASQFLSPEQLKSYREMQEQQAAMQQMGLKMARGMFGSGKGAAPAPAK